LRQKLESPLLELPTATVEDDRFTSVRPTVPDNALMVSTARAGAEWLFPLADAVAAKPTGTPVLDEGVAAPTRNSLSPPLLRLESRCASASVLLISNAPTKGRGTIPPVPQELEALPILPVVQEPRVGPNTLLFGANCGVGERQLHGCACAF
jgi:hypothetical protein